MSQKLLPRVGVFLCSFLLLVCNTPAQSIADLTSNGNTAQKQGHYDEAISSWNAVLAKDSNNGAAYRARGTCYFHKNDFEKAIGDFTWAIVLNANDTAAYSGRGDAYFKEGNLDGAIRDFNRAVNDYWGKQDWDNVITNAAKVIELSAKDDMQRAWAYDTRGLAWQFKENLDNALADFNSAIQLSPTWDAPLANRAQVRQKKGDLQEALADLNEAVRLNPTNEENYEGRATIYGTTKDWDADIKNWNEAIQNNPTNANFLWDRAYGYQHGKKDFDRAIADYNKAVELDTQSPDGYVARGYAYQRQNLPEKAIPDFTKLIQMQPTNSSAYYRRAQAYFEAGKYQETRSDFEEVIRLNPKSSFGYLELAWCLATCPDSNFRNGKEALELARKGCAFEEKPEACSYALAVASAEVGDFDEAVRSQKQAISYSRQLADTNGAEMSAKAEAIQKKLLQLFEQRKPYHGIVMMSDYAD